MKFALRVALTGGVGLLCMAVRATTYISQEDMKAISACLAKWKAVDGIWEGEASTPGAVRGEGRYQRVGVRLEFSRSGTILLVKDKWWQPWVRVGVDPEPVMAKTDFSVRMKGPVEPRDHYLVFNRLRESSAKVTYSRQWTDERPGNAIVRQHLRGGVVARLGSPVPTGLEAELWECASQDLAAGR